MNFFYILLITTVIISAILLINTSYAYADYCGAENIYNSNPQIYRISSNVFVGNVTSIDKPNDNGDFAVNFNIEKIWKGKSDQKSIKLMANTFDFKQCRYSITIGKKYLVYAVNASPYPPFVEGPWTKPYAEAQNDLAFLNDPNFITSEKARADLNDKLEIAKNELIKMMEENKVGFQISMVSVDPMNSTLLVVINSKNNTLSEDEYLKKIKDIVGDYPITIGFGEMTSLNTLPEFSLTSVILLVSVASVIVFYRLKIQNIN